MDAAANQAISEELVLQYKPVTKTQSAVTAKLGGDVLYMDKFDLSKSKQRAEFVKSLQDAYPAIDAKQVEDELIGIATKNLDPPKQEEKRKTREELLNSMTPLARQSARSMLEDEQLAKRLLADIKAAGVAGEQRLALTIYLIGVSRILNNPLAGIIQGPSSSGKSYTINTVASLFPPEVVIMATSMTPQSLFYMQPGALSHKLVVCGERSRIQDDESADATRALREMLSAGKLSKLLPVKEQGEMQTKLIEQEGPIAYLESTTLTDIFDEDLNRAILLHTDERQSQTKKIVSAIAQKFESNGAAGSRALVERHHALQRMLEPLSVVIPFAQRLAESFLTDRVEARRAFPHFLTLVASSALLHQFQRQRNANGYVLANQDDYQLARSLMVAPLSRQLGGGLSDPARRFAESIYPIIGQREFTVRDARKQSKGSERAVRGWLAELLEAGLAQVVTPASGPRAASWQIVTTPDEVDDRAILPPTETFFSHSHCQHAD